MAMINTAADDLRRFLIEPEPEPEPEPQVAVCASSEDKKTLAQKGLAESTQLALTELAELAQAYKQSEAAAGAGRVDMSDTGARSMDGKHASQLRLWWSEASTECLQSACSRPETAASLLALITARHGHQAQAADGDTTTNTTDSVDDVAPEEDCAAAMPERRLSWLSRYLIMTIDTSTTQDDGKDDNIHDFVESLVQALDTHGLVMGPRPVADSICLESMGWGRLSDSVLGRVSAAVEALLEVELPFLAAAMIHGSNGHAYGTVSSLVNHWCTGCFCTGVISAWCVRSILCLQTKSWLFTWCGTVSLRWLPRAHSLTVGTSWRMHCLVGSTMEPAS
jgi:hypothetical protein